LLHNVGTARPFSRRIKKRRHRRFSSKRYCSLIKTSRQVKGAEGGGRRTQDEGAGVARQLEKPEPDDEVRGHGWTAARLVSDQSREEEELLSALSTIYRAILGGKSEIV